MPTKLESAQVLVRRSKRSFSAGGGEATQPLCRPVSRPVVQNVTQSYHATQQFFSQLDTREKLKHART